VKTSEARAIAAKFKLPDAKVKTMGLGRDQQASPAGSGGIAWFMAVGRHGQQS
jgi:hypothetical protein